MITINPGETKEIILSIKTTVIDPEDQLPDSEEILAMMKRLVDGENVGEDEINDLLGEDNISEIELCTEATMSLNTKGGVEIAYMENEDDENLKTRSRILFNTRDTGLVAMTKEGAMKAILSFEEGKTHICTYDTPFMPIKVYVDSKHVDNKLLTEGHLKLNYVINLNDTPPQHFIVEVKIKESAPNVLSELFN
jgi:uncharacterized beta-barrel protein YwiB (DUF1934 family)